MDSEMILSLEEFIRPDKKRLRLFLRKSVLLITQKFEFGEIEFDYYEAKEIIRKKKVKRNGVFKNEIYQIFW